MPEPVGSVLKYYDRLRFSPAVAAVVEEAGRNPKRMQREVHKQVQSTGTGTKSQQALKLRPHSFTGCCCPYNTEKPLRYNHSFLPHVLYQRPVSDNRWNSSQ
ncbi:hypothetical protein B5F07_07520 [Lachnoclostridium sp. An169]|nr:DUF2992 family protein [Lachnoclostridium sp. An169]OUP84666.1 hypothetical protein B5F07_07520 [Lachnoclostridium sp. An169]